MNLNIAQKLKNLREEAGLTQEKFIEKLEEATGLHISISAYRNYENIEKPRIPKNEILNAICNYYNIDMEYLLNDYVINRYKINISINKELGLTDEAIENLKRINNEYKYSKSNEIKYFSVLLEVNEFIASPSFRLLLEYIKILKILSSYKYLFNDYLFYEDNPSFENIDKELERLPKYLRSTMDTLKNFEEFETIKEKINGLRPQLYENENAEEATEILCDYMTKLHDQWENLIELYEFKIEKMTRVYIQQIENKDYKEELDNKHVEA